MAAILGTAKATHGKKCDYHPRFLVVALLYVMVESIEMEHEDLGTSPITLTDITIPAQSMP